MSEYGEEQIKLIDRLLEFRSGNHSQQSSVILADLISARHLIKVEDEEYERKRAEILEEWERGLTDGQ